MDFSNCGFTEPGIYRYYVQESGYNQGVTNDYNVNGDDNCWRTIDVYVEDATYTPAGATTAVNALRIAGYVMYVGKQTAGPAAGTGTATAANSMEDGLTHTNPSGNGGANGVEVASATKSEGIRNIYETSDITFSKTVAGNQASKDKYFKFHIALTPDTRTDAGDGAVLTVKDTDMFIIKNTGASDTPTYDIISSWNSDSTRPNSATTYTKDTIYAANAANAYEETAGTVSYRYVTGAQLKAGYDFYLQDGQEITIQGLPNGIGYTLAEYQDDYTPTVAMTSTTGYDNKNGDTTGSEITAPVIANVSNVKYLNTDSFGKYSLSGSIFLDSRNAPDFSDDYSLIYGHHMEYGRMFGALDDFLDVPYLNSHSSGTLIVGKDAEKTYRLTVFAAMRASAKDETVFDPGKGDIRQFIKEHCETYTADTGQRILALSTCAEGDSVSRTLVFCYID